YAGKSARTPAPLARRGALGAVRRAVRAAGPRLDAAGRAAGRRRGGFDSRRVRDPVPAAAAVRVRPAAAVPRLAGAGGAERLPGVAAEAPAGPAWRLARGGGPRPGGRILGARIRPSAGPAG